MRLTFLVFATLCVASAASQKSIPINDTPAQLSATAYAFLDPTNAALSYADSDAFVAAVLPTLGESFCVIHIVRWADTGANTIDKQNWYVYQRKISASDYAGTRIYGAKNLGVIYVYLNSHGDPAKSQGITYKVDVTQKTPDNLQNLGALVKFGLAGLAAPPVPDAFFVSKVIDVSYPTSDLKFTAFISPQSAPSPAAPTQLTTMTFDNEGKYFWDVDFSIPLKSYKDVQLDQSSNTIQPKSITRQNVFATFEFFPLKVDTKRAKTVLVPSLVAGIPISGKPLDRYIIAVGLGTNVFRGFIGLGIDRRTANLTGQPLSVSTPSDQWVKKLTFGIIVPLRPILQKWSSSSKPSQ
jgi:hypothetical protein